MKNDIEIYIMPDKNTLGQLSIDPYDTDDCEGLGYQQGIDVDTIDFEEDGTFEIPDGYVGQIESTEELFVWVEIGANQFERESLTYIYPGKYRFKDDYTIEKIGENGHYY